MVNNPLFGIGVYILIILYQTSEAAPVIENNVYDVLRLLRSLFTS